MKRAHLLVAIGAILCLVVSCQKTPTAEVSVSQNELTASAMGGNISVNVSSNVDLTVRISVPWITQTGAPSGGGGLYSFNVERNSSYDPRTATITFSNGEQGVSETVNVIQSQQDAIIPGKLEYELFYEAQTFTLPISANVDYTVSLDGGDWIKSLGTRGLSSKQYQFSIAENTGKTSREAVLNISSERMKQSIKIVQLPTTHRPVTKEEWKKSCEMIQAVAKKTKPITDKAKKDPVSGWDKESIAKEIQEIGEVISAVPDRYENQIYLLQRDSTYVTLLLEYNKYPVDAVNTQESSVGIVPKTTRSTIDNSERNRVSPNGKKALLLCPFVESHIGSDNEDHGGIYTDYEAVNTELKAAGFQKLVYLHDSGVRIEHFYGDSLAKYDLVMVNSHGGLFDASHGKGEYRPYNVICIGAYDNKNLFDFVDELGDEKETLDPFIHSGSCGYSVDSDWFDKTTHQKFPNTIFIIGACHSFETIRGGSTVVDYRSSLRKNGALAYCGFTGLSNGTINNATICSLVRSLCRGMSVIDAVDYMHIDKAWYAKEILPGLGINWYRTVWNSNFNYVCSDKAFLIDPTPHNLNEAIRDNKVTMMWEVYRTSGNYTYDVFVDDDDNRVNNNSMTGNGMSYDVSSSGNHSWWIVANLHVDGEVIASYKSDVRPFVTTGPSVAVTGVRIRPSTVSIEPGETYQLTATVMPDNASNKAVEWKSNHPELVSVDENGLITAIKRQAGTTVYITAKTVDGGKSSTCQVTVKEPSGGEVAVTGISLNQTSAELEVGKTLQLKSTITPSNATNKSVQWTSSNSAVASVDINGLVTAKAIGTAKITAKTEDGGKTATVSITVKKASEQNVPVTGVSINMSSLSLTVGESATLTTTIAPANATNKGVTWTTSMSSVATVTSDGVVTAKAAGTAVITAKTEDGGKTATCNVTVTYTPDPGGEVSVTQVTISPTSVNMTVGDTKQFSVKIDPANATNQEVSWSSSDPSVASIDSKGLVTAKAEGKATITVTANDGGVSSKATVTVNNKTVPVTGVSVSPASLSMEIGESKALSVTVSPSDATDKTYTVTSDNTGVVDIDNSNNIVAKGAGTANVLITTADGGFTAKCVVTVNKPQMTISVEPSSLAFGDVNVGERSTKTFSISNTGKAEVKVSGISVPEAYSVDVTTPFTIAVGQSKTVTVTFTPTDGKDYNGSITITSDADSQPVVSLTGTGVEASTPTAAIPEAVDLGLSVKWASFNLGASKPEEFGFYIAWGETREKSIYDWSTYKWCNGTSHSITKYVTDNYYGPSIDNKVELELNDDACHVILGGNWRMPTVEEWDELKENCNWIETSVSGVYGRKIISKINGNSIFLPAAGHKLGTDYTHYGTNGGGYYWTSTLSTGIVTDYAGVAGYFDSNSNINPTKASSSRSSGHSIRPIMSK